MNRTFTILAVLSIAGVGIDASAQPETKRKETPMVKESAWTWGYFFADKDPARVKALFGERKQAINVYRVDKIVSVKGKPGVSLDTGSTLIRVESAAKLSEPGEAGPKLLFHGVPRHLDYTTSKQRADLTKRSRAELPPGKDTVAVIIPIRKNAKWWALPTDERMAFFQKRATRSATLQSAPSMRSRSIASSITRGTPSRRRITTSSRISSLSASTRTTSSRC